VSFGVDVSPLLPWGRFAKITQFKERPIFFLKMEFENGF